MGVRKLHDGELLVTEGEPNTTLFALTEGRISVTSKVDGNERVVYTMKPGECAGTRAFVDRKPRQATLRSVGESTVYTLEPEAFESLLETHPRIVYKVMRSLFRITHTNLMHMNMESQALSNYINKTGGRF
ncbi:Crp/Fnr family transcriptional regulator [Sulfurirhabdus autotrophica]|uniref:Cyclic nucleotide-binding protein n=1 Tax=Sulfurirhabdus autotrophica TaxID=1706046 RepID=A0A4R3YEG5_9PROT|nr:cyclic nucleotide-binding domain-containing protein [Sulfurirhabdus autotrophica]TCV90460.1 cyclic nucleotide-binding protein [Sulfurirhabdus autotrophica]